MKPNQQKGNTLEKLKKEYWMMVGDHRVIRTLELWKLIKKVYTLGRKEERKKADEECRIDKENLWNRMQVSDH